jgi:hypothetical protein
LTKIDTYIPNNLIHTLTAADDNKRQELLYQYENENKPWYLWKVNFGKNETLQIIVKYRLPCGVLKSNRFFNYILSTGAGWKGRIEAAKVVVNLKDIPADQVLSASPKHNFNQAGKQLTWNFKNLEPTTQDDILINYEIAKGEHKAYIARIQRQLPSYYVDNKKIISRETPLNAEQIAKLEFARDYPTEKNGAILAFTNSYTLKRFKEQIKSVDSKTWKVISQETAMSFKKHYQLQLNNKFIVGEELFGNLFDLYDLKITHAKIKLGRRKNTLIITTDSLLAKPTA